MMMAMLAVVLLGQESLPDGAKLVRAAYVRYASAQSLDATINSEINDGARTTVRFTTTLRYTKPNLFYLAQTKSVDGPADRYPVSPFKTSLCICDGRQVSYDEPGEAKRLKGWRGYELAKSPDGEPFDLPTLFMISRGSLLERSLPLDFLLADPLDTSYLGDHILSAQTTGRSEVDGMAVYSVEGKFNDFILQGTYRMTIDDQGNLLDVVLHAPFRLENDRIGGNHEVVLQYKIQAKYNAVVDRSRFKIK
jgi:hypothetical protein